MNGELTSGRPVTIARTELTCGTCATRFCVDDELLDALARQRTIPKCPAGHGTYAQASTVAGNLRDQVERGARRELELQRTIDELRADLRRHAAARAAWQGVIKRLRARLEQAGGRR